MAEKQNSKDRLKEITASIEDGIKELFQSETYAQYLQIMSRFHHYSVNNQVLIHMQKPDATLVPGFLTSTAQAFITRAFLYQKKNWPAKRSSIIFIRIIPHGVRDKCLHN